jgi:hypothetical protein
MDCSSASFRPNATCVSRGAMVGHGGELLPIRGLVEGVDALS